MSDFAMTIIIGSMVGIVGTGLGGFLAILVVSPKSRFLGMLLGGTSGLMIAIVTFDLLPHAFEIGGLWTQILGICLGIGIIFCIENMLPNDNNSYMKRKKRNNFFKTGILLGLGIAMHNLPEGLAIGSGFVVTKRMGLTMALVIALHNLPEGMAMATSLRLGGSSSIKVVLLTLLAGMPTGLGALLGYVLGNKSEFLIALCLSLAGGTMLYITCGELIPSAKALHKGRASTIGLVFGFILGLYITVKL